MKSVLISIQPYWVFLIIAKLMGWEIDKNKIIEVRKNFPKAEDWNKLVKIYCSKDKNSFNLISKAYQPLMQKFLGKVIGEFVCDSIICSQAYFDSQGKNHLTNIFEEDIKRTCLTEYELWNYIAGKAVKSNQMYDGYLWHISDLKIYDKPKDLSEFKKPCDRFLDCITCKRLVRNDFLSCDNKITRPPQSWCYVEKNKNEQATEL